MAIEEKLASQVWQYFTGSRTARAPFEADFALGRVSVMRSENSLPDWLGMQPESSDDEEGTEEEAKPCGCTGTETCPDCLPGSNMSVGEILCNLDKDPFHPVAELLTNTKIFDLMTHVNKAYSPIGNKPFKISDSPLTNPSEEELAKAASSFKDFIEGIIAENNITVEDIPVMFDTKSMAKMTIELRQAAVDELELRRKAELDIIDKEISAVFESSDYMERVKAAIEDAAEFPYGVLWHEPASITSNMGVEDGRFNKTVKIRPRIINIPPEDVWATSDWRVDREGTAVTVLKRLTMGDMNSLKDIAEGRALANLRDVLRDNPDGYSLQGAKLFASNFFQPHGVYDVLVCRGLFSRDALAQYGVNTGGDAWGKAEVWFIDGKVIRAVALPDSLLNKGFFTIQWRTKGRSILGISLRQFIEPFARMYRGTFENIDKGAGRAVSSIVSIDDAAIKDADKLYKVDVNGEEYIDLSGNLAIMFSSLKMAGAPNFKGNPINIDKLPHDLEALVPLLNVALEHLEIVTGIPSILRTGLPNSSAVRTDGMFNMAFDAASGGIQQFLRTVRRDVIRPSVRTTHFMLVENGTLNTKIAYTVELSDRLNADAGKRNDAIQWLQMLAQFQGVVPPDSVAGMINDIGREYMGYSTDIVPGQDALAPSKGVAPEAPPAGKPA